MSAPPRPAPPRAASAALALAALGVLAGGCTAGTLGSPPAAAVPAVGGAGPVSSAPALAPAERAWSPPRVLRPRVRTGGARLPAFVGSDPSREGRFERAAGLWVRQADRETAAPPLVRTAHVEVRTDAAWGESEQVARAAERHVAALVGTYGDALDLRVPFDPLPVVLHARRASFAAALAGAAPGLPGWGAFYDVGSGAVHVSLEPAPRGALPWIADLRHEMTHQVLDLSRPLSERRALFQDGGLWLWEGFAAATETLGDGPSENGHALRQARFAERLRRGEVDPLATLFRLDLRGFEGRHYDQAALLVTFLLEDGVPGARAAFLDTLRARLEGRGRPGDFERRLGRTAPEIEIVWRARAPGG